MTPVVPPDRPTVDLNCAVSLDGRLAYAHGRRARLSGPKDLERVQRLRAGHDAILVGVGTVLLDDPSLRVHWELLHEPEGRSPMRIVLDSHGRTPPHAKVLDATSPTLVATTAGCERPFPGHIQRFQGGDQEVDVPSLLREMYRRGIRSVLVEGGARVLATFLRLGVADSLTVYVAPVVIGGTSAPAMVSGRESEGPEGALALTLEGIDRLDDGVLLRYLPAAPR